MPAPTEKVIFNKGIGNRFVFEPTLQVKYETLARQLAWFGSGTQSLFKIGPYAHLVGRPPDGLPVTGATDDTVELDFPQLFDRGRTLDASEFWLKQVLFRSDPNGFQCLSHLTKPTSMSLQARPDSNSFPLFGFPIWRNVCFCI